MSKAQFQLAYDGPAVRAGSMDVFQLAPALLAAGDLIREANLQLNENRANVSVQVKSDFKRGSFEVSLILDQSLAEQAKGILLGSHLSDAKQLIHFIFGTDVGKAGAIGATIGLLSLWKKLKGEKPKQIISDTLSGVVITINASDGSQVNVNPQTAELYAKQSIRDAISGTVRPLTVPGIDVMEVRRGNKTIERISKDELPESFQGDSTMGTDRGNVHNSKREVYLRVTKANFEKGKWGFSDGSARFNAEIEDEQFKRKLDAREIGFFKGDALFVVLKTRQTVVEGMPISSQYIIERVIDYVPAPTQHRFPIN